MNASLLQKKLYAAYAKSAGFVGTPYTLYRPNSSLTPIASDNIVTTLSAAFNAEDMGFQKPEKYGAALWYCLIDGTQTLVGDYLNGAGGTFFLAAMQPLLPIVSVKCNRSVRIGRMPLQTGAGYAGYSGIVESAQTDVLGTSGAQGSFVSGWPASILLGGKADRETGLPSDVKQGGYVILLPATVPVVIVESDIVQDDMGRNYAIDAAELTDLGWRILATEEHA